MSAMPMGQQNPFGVLAGPQMQPQPNYKLGLNPMSLAMFADAFNGGGGRRGGAMQSVAQLQGARQQQQLAAQKAQMQKAAVLKAQQSQAAFLKSVQDPQKRAAYALYGNKGAADQYFKQNGRRDPFSNAGKLGADAKGGYIDPKVAAEMQRANVLKLQNDAKSAGGYSLSQGQSRFDADGNQVANVAAADNSAMTEYQKAQIAIQKAKASQEFGQGAKHSLNPIYGRDADGNYVVGQLTADGQLKQSQMPDGFNPINPYDKAFMQRSGSIQGEVQGEASSGLSNAIAGARDTLATTAKLATHEGAKGALGPFLSKLPDFLLSEDAIDFKAQQAKLSGQVFLQGYQQLKGAGIITDFEGERAENSLLAASNSQSPESYRAAMDEFNGLVTRGMARQYQRAGLDVPADIQDLVKTYSQREPLNAEGGWTDLGNGIRIKEN